MSDRRNVSEREFVLQFISAYRDMPALWKSKSKEYMDKYKRFLAIKQLTKKMQLYRENITEKDVRKKINILRTSFRRENRKIKESLHSGSGIDDMYVPTLWFYKELEFLQDQEESGIPTIIIEDEKSPSPPSSISSFHYSASTSPVQKWKKQKEDLQLDPITLPMDHFNKPETESQVIARNWAFKLERLSASQRRLAEKFITDILFEGEEGNLHRDSVIINPHHGTLIPHNEENNQTESAIHSSATFFQTLR